MSTMISPCFYCKHFKKGNTCAAFPAGIPIEVLTGDPHVSALPDQTGTLVYEPAKGSPAASELVGYEGVSG